MQEEAKKIIEENVYMTIATVLDNKPWISPVFFAYDISYNLYWVSSKEARHSQAVRNKSEIAIVIFNSQAPEGEGDGVYFESTATELNDTQSISEAMNVLSNRVSKDEFRVKSLEEVSGDAVWRIYKAVPHKIYKLTSDKAENGQYVDKRIEVSLP